MEMKQILLLLLKGAELWEIAAFTDIFGWNQICGEKGWRLVTAGPDLEVRLSFGHRMKADLTWAQVDPTAFSALAIPGGFPRYGYFRACGEYPLQLIRCFHQAEKPIAAVCTGSLLLAKAGILEGRQATTYSSPDTFFQKELVRSGAVVKENALLIEDGNLITGDGPGAAGAVAFALLSRCTGIENSRRIKNLMHL